MARRDLIHYAVVMALQKAGWTITHDPLTLQVPGNRFEVDLGAEKVIIAERGLEREAIEIKSFQLPSILASFYEALGKYMAYQKAFIKNNSDRRFYMAISTETYDKLQHKPFLMEVFKDNDVKMLIVDVEKEEIVQWID